MEKATFSGITLAVVAALASGAASAATSSTMAVSASIAAECAVTQNTAINFGALTMLTAGVAATTADVGTGSFNAICTNGTGNPKFQYSSLNTSGTDFLLKGTDGATIAYSVHQDAIGAAGTVVAYNTAATYTGFAADGTAQVLNVSAKVQASDKAGKKVQAYSDVITVTTTFDV